MNGKSSAHHARPRNGTQISCCFRKNFRNGIRPMKTSCSTRMSTHERWLETTRYQSRRLRPSSPSACSRRTPIARKINPLQRIQASASAVMPRLTQARHCRTGTISFATATIMSSGTQKTTFATISDRVMTPFSVEPRLCTVDEFLAAGGMRLCPVPTSSGATMPLELSALEARVIGCLLEKQVATPDQYPLSLNALVNACNQRSNRDPVLNLEEREVQAVVDGLMRKQLVLEKSGFGSRVPKYHQLFCNTQFGSLQFSPQQTAIVCELLLRGPQTPGELRTHAARLAPIRDVSEVEAAVEDLMTRPEGPYVVRLAREPGRRESRYAQLFTGEPVQALAPEPGGFGAESSATAPDLVAR